MEFEEFIGEESSDEELSGEGFGGEELSDEESIGDGDEGGRDDDGNGDGDNDADEFSDEKSSSISLVMVISGETPSGGSATDRGPAGSSFSWAKLRFSSSMASPSGASGDTGASSDGFVE